MEDFFLQEPANPSPNRSVNMASTSNADKIYHVNVPYQNSVVLLMDHPASVTLYKHVQVSAVSGSVSINGYELRKRSSIQVFSSEKTGLIKMKTETNESVWKKKVLSTELGTELFKIFHSESIRDRILQRCGDLTIVVLVERCVLPPNLEFAELYCPQAFDFNLFPKNKYKDFLWFPGEAESSLKFGEEEENLATEIALLIGNAKMTDSNSHRIIVCGHRNTGKSMLLQYLVNKMLTKLKTVYYLDTDPGQPEFTPPGVVSLTKVEQPIFGPPFSHLDKESTMIFTGAVSPSFLDMYSKSICTLMETYNNEYSDDPLFVNTMGWVEGTGLQCLINTIATVKPTVLVEIVPKGESSMFDYREYLPPDSHYFQICFKHDQKKSSGLSAKMMRDLSVLSHLGNCQPPYLSVSPINELQPYCVSFKKIPIFVFPGGNILPSRMVEAVNESIVALCCVPETAILESGIPEFPKTLEFDPENQCLAYGLVQAVDEAENLLYVIAPLKENQWSKVNAIIKGNVMVPDSLILQQEIYNVPLPYTDVNEETSSDEEMDLSMLSLKYLSETEAESPEQKPCTRDSKSFSSVQKYRKPIGKRYSGRFSKKSKR